MLAADGHSSVYAERPLFLAREMDIEDATCFLDIIYNMHVFCVHSNVLITYILVIHYVQCVQDNTETVHGYTQALVSFLCGRHLQIVDWLLPFYTPAFRLTRTGMGNFNYSSIQMYYVTSRGLSQRALSRLERATMAAN